ncbi:hypothetical protein Trydic_g6791 [Trypoxylus dichotomus]
MENTIMKPSIASNIRQKKNKRESPVRRLQELKKKPRRSRQIPKRKKKMKETSSKSATPSYYNWQKVDTITDNAAESLKKHLVEKQTAKFQRIDNTTQYKLDPSRTVVNPTDKTLPPEAISILEEGGNFAVTPKSIPKEEIIANMEAATRRLPTTERDAVVQTLHALLPTSKQQKSNTSSAEWNALKQLKLNESLTIIQADKGNATVIINAEEYKQKIKMLLDRQHILVKVLSLPDDVKKQVTVTEALPPRLCGLPKIQKRDVSLGAIVSAIGTPMYLLAKHLTTLLQPYIGGKPSYIRDSVDFVEKLQKIQFNPGDMLASFDAVSLFTKVPLIDTLRYIADLFPSYMTQLFKHCLRTSYFVRDGSFYKQTNGVAMGSPLSPVVANLFMKQFESLDIETAVNKPTI